MNDLGLHDSGTSRHDFINSMSFGSIASPTTSSNMSIYLIPTIPRWFNKKYQIEVLE
jgi:hypothetical protein